MRTTCTRCLAALITTTSLLGVSACGSKTSTAQPVTLPSTISATPTTSATPTVSSTSTASPSVTQNGVDQAEATVTKLIQVRDKVGQDPSTKIETLVSVSRDDAYLTYMREFMQWREKQWIQKGDEKVVSMQANGHSPLVKVNTCIDVSNTTVVDAQGKSIVSPNRPSRSSAIFTVKKFKDGWFITNENSSGEKC